MKPIERQGQCDAMLCKHCLKLQGGVTCVQECPDHDGDIDDSPCWEFDWEICKYNEGSLAYKKAHPEPEPCPNLIHTRGHYECRWDSNSGEKGVCTTRMQQMCGRKEPVKEWQWIIKREDGNCVPTVHHYISEAELRDRCDVDMAFIGPYLPSERIRGAR